MPQGFLACSYSNSCSGCDWLLKPAEEQRRLKLDHLASEWRRVLPMSPALESAGWVSIAKGGLRDRVDLIFDRRTGVPRLGLFDKFRTGIVDLQGCPQLSPALEEWLRAFRQVTPPIERGSIRLRVSPSGRSGVWLDFANVDVKTLLDEGTTLRALRRLAVVEIGQRRKRLIEVDGRLKLGEPVLEPWFETYLGDGRAVPLYCSVASFTQPGFAANRALVGAVTEAVRDIAPKRAIEFGSGIGNFTLPLASVCESVQAYEVDENALEGLRRSIDEQGLGARVAIHAGNFQTGKRAAEFEGTDLVVVDPPRSGLMSFLDPLEALARAARPKHFLYVSCFAESFAQDSARLIGMGYGLERLAIVDQFPQSRHYEIVARFSLA